MNCMKCGREVPLDRVFCDSCLEEMKRYPIRPDTPIHLPPEKERTAARAALLRRRIASPEQDQLRRLRIRLRLAWAVIGLLLVILTALSFWTVGLYSKSQKPLPGQNYTTITSKALEPES